jgi:hypothetical protein
MTLRPCLFPESTTRFIHMTLSLLTLSDLQISPSWCMPLCRGGRHGMTIAVVLATHSREARLRSHCETNSESDSVPCVGDAVSRAHCAAAWGERQPPERPLPSRGLGVGGDLVLRAQHVPHHLHVLVPAALHVLVKVQDPTLCIKRKGGKVNELLPLLIAPTKAGNTGALRWQKKIKS